MKQAPLENPPSLINRLVHDRGALFSLARYLTIGSLVAAIDLGSFQALLRAGVALVVATTIAYILGVCSHFTLNKFFNFRDVSRSTASQAQTYAVIVALSGALTLAIVTAMTHAGVAPLYGKIASIIVNIPFGFLCHRFITFGPGIRATVARFLPSAPK